VVLFLQLSWEGHLMGMVIGCVLGAYDGRSGTIGEEETKPAAKQTVKSKDVSEKVRHSQLDTRMRSLYVVDNREALVAPAHACGWLHRHICVVLQTGLTAKEEDETV
jgi:hypothetical protein